MKRFTWIMALLAALALVFVGVSCSDGDSGGGGDGDKDGPKAFTLVLTDNFRYAHGYQGSFTATDYFTGKISKDDVFIISFKVKASRDLEDKLTTGLVDQTSAANYWKALTWPGDPVDPDAVGPEEAPFITAGTEVEFEFEWTALASSTGPAKDANNVVFGTAGTCNKPNCETNCNWKAEQGTEGAGVKGPVTLTFTDFTLKRKGAAAEPCCKDCEATCSDCLSDDCTDDCGEDGTCCVPSEPPVIPQLDVPIDLGEFTFNKGTGDTDGSESQAVWDGIPSVNILGTDVLVVKTENEITGTMQLIHQSAANAWGWDQTAVTTSTGGSLEGISVVSEDKKTITITLSAAIGAYDVLLAAAPGNVKLTLAYYSGPNKIHGLGIQEAYLDKLPIELGEPTFNLGTGDTEGSESQAVWDGIDFIDLMSAKYLVVKTTEEITGSMQLIHAYTGNWWNQEDILTSTGGGKEGMTVVSEDKKTVTITLATGLKDYDTLLANAPASVKITLAYYTGANKIRGLGIEEAYLKY